MLHKIKDALVGFAVGDALGVPVEFQSRKQLEQHPVLDMQEYGTHNQPAGTWSDDSSLTFCLADSLSKEYNLQDVANCMVRWYTHGCWTPHGQVFDIGGTTRNAIYRLMDGEDARYSGDFEENSNGNGSLMRILPLAFYLLDKPIEERYQVVKEVSSITHAHARSVVCCFIYVEFAIRLLQGKDKYTAYRETQDAVNNFIQITYTEQRRFDRVLLHDITAYPQEQIHSSGYVLHTLEACLWCLLKHTDYVSTVLAAVILVRIQILQAQW